MNHARTRRLTAGAVAMTMLGGLLSLVLFTPAQAVHTSGLALEVTPEVSAPTIGAGPTSASITAKLVDPATGQDKPPPTAVPVVISFEVTGGPADPDGNTPQSPDATCSVTAPATSCSPAGIIASSAGAGLVRAWIEEDNLNPPAGFVEADLDEGRLSDAVRDCTTETSPGAFQACESGTAVPGSTGERDITDVVSVQFTTGPAKLDCSPESGKAPRTEEAQITCVARDTNNDLLSGQRLDGENLNGANDPDSQNGGTVDYNNGCITGESGSCTITISAAPGGGRNNQIGTANICIFVDEDDDDAYSPAGTAPGDGSDCDEAKGAAENANTTDVVSVTWEERVLTSLDVTPDVGQSSQVGGSHTMTATARDQFGAKWTATNTVVRGEFFTGSPKDGDGNNPGTPDLGACNTTSGDSDEDKAACTFAYTSAPSAGSDVMCFWFGDTPTMSGSGLGGATCDGEGLVSGPDIGRIDVVSKSWSAPSSSTSTTTTTTTPPAEDVSKTQGYTLVGSDGGIFNFGTSQFHGSTGDLELNEPVIGLANKKGGSGYWLVARDGGIFTFGDAEFFGSLGSMTLNAPILGMEATPTGKGYWLFAADGGIFTFGDADFFGSTGSMTLNAPMVGMGVTEDGEGYWLVAQDGGIFTFGNAPFHGSTGSMTLNQPVFDMTPTGGDKGYWLVAKDGGIFSFGDAGGKFYGSAVGSTTATVIGIGSTPTFNGYWIADSRGAVFPFGDARNLGDRRSNTNNAATVGFATVPKA